jgi:site-specific DNA recombinase
MVPFLRPYFEFFNIMVLKTQQKIRSIAIFEQDFNSLDAQRVAAEKYIQSQVGKGWIVLPQYYDDGGFSCGNMNRPALTELLRDVELKKIDCVVTYKLDRLSRSLLDFATMRISDARLRY